MDVGVEGEAEVEHDDLEQRIEGRAEGVEIAVRRCPGCLQIEGLQKATCRSASSRCGAVRHADAQPAGDIGGAVIAGGQAVEIAAVRLLQPADGCLVRKERGEFGQPAQVLVEAVGKTVLGGGRAGCGWPSAARHRLRRVRGKPCGLRSRPHRCPFRRQRHRPRSRRPAGGTCSSWAAVRCPPSGCAPCPPSPSGSLPPSGSGLPGRRRRSLLR